MSFQLTSTLEVNLIQYNLCITASTFLNTKGLNFSDSSELKDEIDNSFEIEEEIVPIFLLMATGHHSDAAFRMNNDLSSNEIFGIDSPSNNVERRRRGILHGSITQQNFNYVYLDGIEMAEIFCRLRCG
jgi:hypothetical protein